MICLECALSTKGAISHNLRASVVVIAANALGHAHIFSCDKNFSKSAVFTTGGLVLRRPEAALKDMVQTQTAPFAPISVTRLWLRQHPAQVYDFTGTPYEAPSGRLTMSAMVAD
jgi:hypothetical protein